jgi:large subunit ribosomal protein L4
LNSLSSLKLDGKTLIVLDQRDAIVQKSANNLAGVKTLMAHYLNVIDLLNFDTVVISRAAVDVIESYLGQGDTAIDADTANGEA